MGPYWCRVHAPSSCNAPQSSPTHPKSKMRKATIFFSGGASNLSFPFWSPNLFQYGKIMHIGFWIRWGFLILVVTLSPRSSFITKLLKINTTKVIEIRAAPKILVFGGAQNWRKKWQNYCNLSTTKKIFFWRGPKLKIKHDRSIEPDKKNTILVELHQKLSFGGVTQSWRLKLAKILKFEFRFHMFRSYFLSFFHRIFISHGYQLVFKMH